MALGEEFEIEIRTKTRRNSKLVCFVPCEMLTAWRLGVVHCPLKEYKSLSVGDDIPYTALRLETV
jgi:hypothetical protein